MSKHTPGPWRVCGLNVACNKEIVVASCYRDSLESVVVRPKEMEECLANARLIAAAPELLEALKDAIETAEFEKHPFRPWHKKAKDVIARIEGGE